LPPAKLVPFYPTAVPDNTRIEQLKERIKVSLEALATFARTYEELLAMPTPEYERRKELLRMNVEIAAATRMRIAWAEDELRRLTKQG
jgi:hypothetical protein